MVAATAAAEHKRPARYGQCSACVAGAAALLAASPGSALEWSYTPGASVGASNDTNIRLLFAGAEPVNAMSVAGSVDVLARNEAFEFHASPRVDVLRYDDPTVQDRNDEYADVGISLHDERQRWSFGVNYADEGTRNSEFESNGYAAVDYDRRQTGLTTSWARIMQRGEIDLAASASSVNYQDASFSPYRDYRYDLFQGGYNRSTDERTRWGFSATRSEVTTDRGLVTTTSTDARVTWTHAFSEVLQAHLGFGVLEATTDGLTATRDTAPALDFSVTRGWAFWSLSVGGGRTLQPDGQGSLLQQDRLEVGGTRRLSQRLGVSVTAAKAREKYFVSFYDRNYWQESVSVSWQFKRRWSLVSSVSDHGQQWVTLGLPKQSGVVTQFSISYRGG
jgi:hypothetical protein